MLCDQGIVAAFPPFLDFLSKINPLAFTAAIPEWQRFDGSRFAL